MDQAVHLLVRRGNREFPVLKSTWRAFSPVGSAREGAAEMLNASPHFDDVVSTMRGQHSTG
jgi:hypothetical protein